jgi:hypothetical protein
MTGIKQLDPSIIDLFDEEALIKEARELARPLLALGIHP